ncbi:GyrI-like domain-containing protein [Gaetbulibacter sp. M240]|uniref:AraC family transcriptional regulator n=1 Tax=Gaetbulibacter sp. M240 TaxID=3126511 RepID=UPI00374F08A8
MVFNTLAAWNNWEPPSNKMVKTYSAVPYSKLNQELQVSDSIINIEWEIKRTDSVTVVTAYVKDKNHSLIQKLKVPFVRTDFVNRMIATVKRIQKELNALSKEYKVGPMENSKIPKQYCAYISLESKLGEKASKMMASNAYILTYLEDNNIAIMGHPFVEVSQWNKEKGSMTFNFCFPVAHNEDYQSTEDIKFKMTQEKPALKTIFNGNYRISDCAWFSIIDFAEQKNIDIERLPTEIFFNDPHEGGNDREWKAEIYMPLNNN